MRSVLFLALLLGGCDTWNAGKSYVARYDVTGTVRGTGSKPFASEGGTKFSVNLDTDAGPKIVNCTSTQCGSLLPGQRVLFSCFEEAHFMEPNEEECRFDKLLPTAQ